MNHTEFVDNINCEYLNSEEYLNYIPEYVYVNDEIDIKSSGIHEVDSESNNENEMDIEYNESHDHDQELILTIEETHHSSKKNDNFPNPYRMNRRDVRISHFKDARIYDSDINEPGWQIPTWVARKKYRQWLRSIRKIPGWEGFRRAPREIIQIIEDEEGNTYVIRKLVPYKVYGPATHHKEAGKNSNKRLMPQSKDKGVRYDDENFRPKMFTEKMGREISQLRTSLDLTQAELGKKINVDANMIRNIELGGLITFNSEDMMVKNLAKALGIPSIKYRE